MRKYGLHLLLFLITCITTTLAGSEWIYGHPILGGPNGEWIAPWFTWEKFWGGTRYSIPFLAFLTCHEFGHYFTARYYRVKVSLPYYIPLWLGILSTIGTMGAFIQIKERLRTRKEFFDIGIAGPLAGFVIAFGVLIYGYTHLPPPEYVLEIHPEYISNFPEGYAQYGTDFEQYAYNFPDNEANREAGIAGEAIPDEFMMAVGKNLLMLILEYILVDDPSHIPNPREMMHYPFLFAGFLGLLFTALNLMPIGQLDGGHILYGLLGQKRHGIISRVIFVSFVFYAGLGIVNPYFLGQHLSSSPNFLVYLERLWPYFFYVFFLYLVFSRTIQGGRNILLLVTSVIAGQVLFVFFFPQAQGYLGWMAFAFLIGRVLGLNHPRAIFDQPLDPKRKVLGWISLVIFVLCFSPYPL